MQLVTIEAFIFAELSDKAKEKAREWWRGIQDDTFWSDQVIEVAEQVGELLGFYFKRRDNGKRTCIYWTGFWSQGDGACFEATWHASNVQADKVAADWGDSEATTEIKRIAAELAKVASKLPEASCVITHSARYYHERSMNYEPSDEFEADVHAVDLQRTRESLRV